jgi:cytochrome P450
MLTSGRFTEWAREYGGLYSLKLGTSTAIVLTDPRLVKQLVDKKSSIYSSRPTSYVADLITGGDHLLVMKYGNMWRSFRKIIHQHFMESMVEKEHIQLQNAEAVQMMKDFATNPEQHMLHPKRYSNSIIMSLCKAQLLAFPSLLADKLFSIRRANTFVENLPYAKTLWSYGELVQDHGNRR